MDTHSQQTHHQSLEPDALRLPAERTAALGALGEELAVRHLVHDDGLVVVARNWRIRSGELRGELDVVAVSEAAGIVVICEVKTRRDAARFGGAVTAMTPRQHTRIRALTAAFLREASLPCRKVRLDLVAIDVGRRPTLTHLEGAL